MKKKANILILEKSEIIYQGLIHLLLDKNNTPICVELCKNEKDIKQAIHFTLPQIIIASPTLFEKNANQINTLDKKCQISKVGLVYAYHDPTKLDDYDALIYLNDKADKIRTTIDNLLESQDLKDATPQNDTLTNREKEILKLLVSGNTTKQIATTLFISTHTVNAHRKNIMRKLDIKTVSALTIYAVINGIITLKEV